MVNWSIDRQLHILCSPPPLPVSLASNVLKALIFPSIFFTHRLFIFSLFYDRKKKKKKYNISYISVKDCFSIIFIKEIGGKLVQVT